MNWSRFINFLLIVGFFIAISFGIYDFWFRPKLFINKPQIKTVSKIADPPADPFSSTEMEYFRQLTLKYNTGQFEGALKYAEELLLKGDLSSGFGNWLRQQIPVLMTSLAWLKIQSGDCPEAQKILYRAVQRGAIPETKKALGVCLLGAKEWPEASTWLADFVKDRPQDLEGRLLFADSLESLGRFDEAVLNLDAASQFTDLTAEQKLNLSNKLTAMKVKAQEGLKQKSEFSRRFYVSYLEHEHEAYLPQIFETLESSTDEFSELLGLEPVNSPIEVILYSKEAFRSVIPGGPEWSEGMFDGRIRVPFHADMKRQNLSLLTTILRHELVHALLSIRSKRRSLPTWFDEGLAQLLACRLRECSGFRFGVSPGDFLSQKMLNEPFVTLTTIEAGMAYQQSLYLTRFLAKTQNEDVFKSMLRDLEPAGPITSDFLIRKAGYDSFEKARQSVAGAWVKKLVY